MTVDDVISPNLRQTIRIVVLQELETALQDMCHNPPVTLPLINSPRVVRAVQEPFFPSIIGESESAWFLVSP